MQKRDRLVVWSFPAEFIEILASNNKTNFFL